MIGRLKWFIIGLLIGALVAYIFTSEGLSGVRDKVKKLLSLGMGVAYAGEVIVPGGGSLVQEVNGGEIDWTAGVIRVTGRGVSPGKVESYAQGQLMAMGAAQLDAERILAGTVNGVQLDSERTLRGFIQRSYKVKERVSACLKGARIVGTRFLSNGVAEVEMELPLVGEGGLTRIIYSGGYGYAAKPDFYYPRPGGAVGGEVYTGLIIDARGLGLKPAMNPKVLSENGALVYGMDRRIMEDKKFVIKQGLVAYVRTMEKAKELKRIGKNPFVVRATGVAGQFKTDVVIGEEQAKAILKLKGLLTFWEQCRVAIVLN